MLVCHICSTWFVYYHTKKVLYLVLCSDNNGSSSLNYIDMGTMGGGVTPHCVFSSLSHSELLWTWNLLGNSSWCVCVGGWVRAAGFKPFSGPLTTTVLLNPPLRSGGFSVCWRVWSPGTTSLLGRRPTRKFSVSRFRSNLWMFPHSREAKVKKIPSELFLCVYTWSWAGRDCLGVVLQ